MAELLKFAYFIFLSKHRPTAVSCQPSWSSYYPY